MHSIGKYIKKCDLEYFETIEFTPDSVFYLLKFDKYDTEWKGTWKVKKRGNIHTVHKEIDSEGNYVEKEEIFYYKENTVTSESYYLYEEKFFKSKLEENRFYSCINGKFKKQK